MTVETVYKIGDKEVSQAEFFESFGDAALEMATNHIRGKIEAIHCEVHNQNAKAVLEKAADGSLKFRVLGCCDAIQDLARTALSK